MYIWDKILDEKIIKFYYNKIHTHYIKHCENGFDKNLWYPTRNIDITYDPITQYIKKFIENKIRVKLNVNQAELQTWYDGCETDLHTHTEKGRQICDFNSLLYLNDDFFGGEFYTENVVVKPVTNRLTFFDGKNIPHGVKTVQGNDRHTIIIWWQNSEFY
jgi:hypothetical protein